MKRRRRKTCCDINDVLHCDNAKSDKEPPHSKNFPHFSQKTYSIPLPKYSFQFFLVALFLPVWIRPIWLVFMSKTCFTHKRMNLFTFFTFVASFDISAITLSILMTASMVWCLNSLSYIGSDWPFQKFIFLCFSFYCNVSKYRPKSFATLVTSRLYDCKSHVVVDLFNWFDPQALSKNNWVKRKWIDRWLKWHSARGPNK